MGQQRAQQHTGERHDGFWDRATVSPSEVGFVAVVAMIVLAATSVPYIYGYLSSPEGKRFMGIVFNVPDHAQYFAWMREFSRSALAENKLTSEQGRAVFFNLQWWLLGSSSRYLGLDYPQAYQIFRLISALLFLFVLYFFISVFIQSQRMRKVAFLTVALGSGFGWVLVVLKQFTGELILPMTVYTAEANAFLCMMAYPHFVFPLIGVLIAFALFLGGYERKELAHSALAGLVGLAVGFIHGFDLITIYAVLLAFGGLLALKEGISRHLLASLFLTIFISSPAVVYSLMVTRLDPIWKQTLAQYNAAGVWTPNPLQLIILMGPIFLIALFTFPGLVPLKQSNNRELFLKAWLIASFLLIYFPVNFQIHLLNGWQIPMAILATLGLFRYIGPYLADRGRFSGVRWARVATDRRRITTGLAIGLVAAVVPTNVYLTAWRVVDLGRHRHPYYLYREEVSALKWLEERASPSDVVLSSETIGLYIPSVSGTRAFLAHGAATVDFFRKQELVKEYFTAATTEEERVAMLRRYGISYVFYGDEERALGDYSPEAVDYLQKVFSEGRIAVYRVGH